MSELTKTVKIFLSLGVTIMMSMGEAQRPSFAGIRPPDGLTQKDKYYLNSLQNSAVGAGVNDIETRFERGEGAGAPATATATVIAYGQTQRPPVGDRVVVANKGNPFVRAPGGAGQLLSAAPQFSVRLSDDAEDNTEVALNGTNGSGVSRAGQMCATNCSSSSEQNQILNQTTAASASSAPSAPSSTPTPPAPLPLDALGDRLLVERLSRLPVDKQPFWYVNYRAIEAQRNNSTPQVGLLQSRSFFAG